MLRFEDRISYVRDWDGRRHQTALIPSMTLQILLENAFRHSVELEEEDSHIRLRVSETPDRLVVEVEDNGMGMAQEQVDALHQGNGEYNTRLSGLAMLQK